VIGALAMFNSGIDTTTAAIEHAGDVAAAAIGVAEHAHDALAGDD
jgi:hypothetical protein